MYQFKIIYQYQCIQREEVQIKQSQRDFKNTKNINPSYTNIKDAREDITKDIFALETAFTNSEKNINI